jgi:hypothetical protein
MKLVFDAISVILLGIVHVRISVGVISATGKLVSESLETSMSHTDGLDGQ